MKLPVKCGRLNPLTLETAVLASGLKGAYAHVEDAEDRIWLTEIADGQVEGRNVAG